MPPATSNGSGRKRNQMIAAATTDRTAANAIGPTLGSSRRCGARRFHCGVSTGPNTAPSVPSQTTAAIARGPSPGSARSAATNRPCKEAACVPPNKTMPTSRSQTQRICPPTRQQQRHRAADHERGDHRRPTTTASTERGERRSHQRRTESEACVAGAGKAVITQQVTDVQREHGDHAGDKRACPGTCANRSVVIVRRCRTARSIVVPR